MCVPFGCIVFLANHLIRRLLTIRRQPVLSHSVQALFTDTADRRSNSHILAQKLHIKTTSVEFREEPNSESWG